MNTKEATELGAKITRILDPELETVSQNDILGAADGIKDYLKQFGHRLYLHYEVKFRAFGITFANISGEIDLGQYSPVPVPEKLILNQRGVKLFLYTKKDAQ